MSFALPPRPRRPGLAGLIIGTVGAASLDATSYVASVLTILAIRHRAESVAAPPEMTTLPTAVHRTVTWGMLPIGSTVAGVVGTAFGLRAADTAALCMIPLLARSMRHTRRLTRPLDARRME